MTDLILEKKAWIEAEAQKPFCKNKFGPGVLKCSCLHVLQNPTLRLPVAKFCVEDVDSKSKTEVDQRVCDWFGYAKLFQKTSKSPLMWKMPFNGTDAYAAGKDITALPSRTICTSAMVTLMGMGSHRYNGIEKSPNTTGVVMSHRNTGRIRSINEVDPRYEPLKYHFEELKSLGEVRATRLTSELVNGTVLENIREEDGNIYLPPSKGYRNQYYRYGADQGYEIKPKANGSLTIAYVGDEVDPPKIVSLWAYYFFLEATLS